MKNNLVNIFLMIGLALTACESNRVYDSIENKAPVIAEKEQQPLSPISY